MANDGDEDSKPDTVLIDVVDTTPPSGSVTAPPHGVCFGGPVVVEDDYTDICDETVDRTYVPGPVCGEHGDHVVTLTATDSSGNSAASSVGFTIDTVAPQVKLHSPWADGLKPQPQLPFAIFFEAHDDDGATGGVLHEVVKLAGCPIYDGWTYGNQDGRLADETLPMSQAELCRLAEKCGFDCLDHPELRVEATDCGGNVGFDSSIYPGSVILKPGLCGGGGKRPGERTGFRVGR